MKNPEELDVIELKDSELENTSAGFPLIVSFLLPFILPVAYQQIKSYIDFDKFDI